MVRIAVMKLSDAARAFYNATPELHIQDTTWAPCKAAFHARFRDVRTDQFHFTHLQTARQKRTNPGRIHGLTKRLGPKNRSVGS
jgi:hypothetical protein